MENISAKRESVATSALQVPRGLVHTEHDSPQRARYWKYHTGRLLLLLLNKFYKVITVFTCSCFPGFMLAEQCRAEHQRSNCTRCPDGQYTAEMNNYPRCMHCRRCKGRATLPSFWVTSLICRCCIRWGFALFTFSFFSTFLQQKTTKYRNHRAKNTKTLFVAVRTVITSFASTQKHTSVSNVHNADLMKRKNRHVSLAM